MLLYAIITMHYHPSQGAVGGGGSTLPPRPVSPQSTESDDERRLQRVERTALINGDRGLRWWRGVSVLISSNTQIKLESVNQASGILASDGWVVLSSERLERLAHWDSLCGALLCRGPEGRRLVSHENSI